MHKSVRFLVLGGVVTAFAAAGCDAEKKQSSASDAAEKIAAVVSEDEEAKRQADEDQRLAANAMPVIEVLAKLQAGVSKEKLLEEVQRRRIPRKIVDINELELAANGAGHKLIAAMKDPANVLTAPQETIYMQLLMQRQATASAKKPVR